MNIGTVFSTIATPIAGALGLECYDPITGDLKPESKCAQTRDRLDAAKNPKEFASAIFDRFRSDKPKGDNMAEETEKKYYTLVVLVEAEDATEALEKRNTGKVLAVNPQQQKPTIQYGGGPVRPAGQGQVITRIQGKAESLGG